MDTATKKPIKLANHFRDEMAKEEHPDINVTQEAIMDMKAILESDTCNLTMALLNRNALHGQLASLEQGVTKLEAMPVTEHTNLLLENTKETLAQARLVAGQPVIPRDIELRMLAFSCLIEADNDDTVGEAIAAALDKLDLAAGAIHHPREYGKVKASIPESTMDPELLSQSKAEPIDIKSDVVDDGLPADDEEFGDDDYDDSEEGDGPILDPNERSVKVDG